MKKINKKEIFVCGLEDLFFYTLYKVEATWEVGPISNYAANRIKNTYKTDFKGYKLCLKSSELLHFLYSHFHEKWIGQRSIKFNDINMVLDVVNNHLTAQPGNKQNTFIFRMKNKSEIFELVVNIDDDKKRFYGKSFRIKA